MRDVCLGLLLLVGGPPEEQKPAVPLYTNDDLERVRPYRDQTGVASRPEAEAGRQAPSSAKPKEPGRGEAYWRREAERVRRDVRRLDRQAALMRARIEAEKARPQKGRGPKRAPELEARLEALRLEARQLEDELSDRARRDGALPGWLR